MKAQYINGRLYLDGKRTQEADAWAKMRAEFIKIKFGAEHGKD